ASSTRWPSPRLWRSAWLNLSARHGKRCRGGPKLPVQKTGPNRLNGTKAPTRSSGRVRMMAKPAWTGAGRFTRIPRKRILAALAALFIVMAGGSPIQAQEEAPLRPLPFGVRYEGGHGVEDVVYELVDERGNTVTLATLLLAPGDLYIDQENWLYEVTSLEGERVRVARRGKAAMPSG